MAEQTNRPKRRWGDRRDGRRVKAPGLQTVMAYLMPKRTDCEVYLHDTIGATLDERIADGFYFGRSLRLIKHIFAHPELLDVPIGVPSEFRY